YEQFLQDNQNKKILFLEIGVGNTTPQFIKHPFQKMTKDNPNALFVTMNQKEYFIPHAIRTKDNPNALFVTMNQKEYFIPHPIRSQTIKIDEHIAEVLHQ